MAYRSSRSSSISPTPSSSPSQESVSLMVRAPEDSDPSSRGSSTRGTPNRHPVDLPRNQASSKGGCWTCRLRRKKCDEQREGESCRTCIRLTIECLGWGPKRPDWMRDKQAVEAYKANIKAQLTRAGLIRGQPRASLIQAQAAETSPPPPTARRANTRSSARPQTFHRLSAPADTSPVPLGLEQDSFGFRYDSRQSLLPGVGGASNSSFHQLPAASYSDPNLSSTDLTTPFFQYSPQSSTPLSTLSNDPLDFDFSHLDMLSNQAGFDFDLRAPSPVQQNFPLLAGQTSMQETHVMYYFENVRKLHYLFGGNAVTNVTYSMIVQEPRGAVTNAVCALASLHFSRMRVAQGFEAPDPNPEHSTAKYFHDEAYFQLANAKQLRGGHNESEVLAALHLVCFSQLSGGTTDWQLVLAIALDWIGQVGLSTDENPKATLSNMSVAGQLVVKCTMWMDIFSSITLMRPPKYFALYKKLLGEDQGFTFPLPGADPAPTGLQMETLTGCPDEALLGIAEVSALAHWKLAEQRRGTLSFRELIRRGDEIEQRLQRHSSDALNFREQSPLHPNLTQAAADSSFSSVESQQYLTSVFRETVMLYLHTILSEANPAVPEISSAVDQVIKRLQVTAPFDLDRALVFPICLAACMTDDSTQRDFLKGRLQSQDENIGNLMRTRLLMEAVWHKRDVSGRAIDWRETLGDRGLNLLLV
ncbi:fungal-specific transcription factor domain-containing protein [Mycena floridula]|nr:fungal-specific transcription factor domain-containing protein [Mycena floridula]